MKKNTTKFLWCSKVFFYSLFLFIHHNLQFFNNLVFPLYYSENFMAQKTFKEFSSLWFFCSTAGFAWKISMKKGKLVEFLTFCMTWWWTRKTLCSIHNTTASCVLCVEHNSTHFQSLYLIVENFPRIILVSFESFDHLSEVKRSV